MLHSLRIAPVLTALFCVTGAGQQPEEALPISMGIVLDTSGSMGTKLALGRRLVSELLKPASSLDEFALVQASDRPVILSGFADLADVVQNQVASTQSRGRSALFDAIYLGVQYMKTGRNARKVLLVISDGGDNSSRYTETEIQDAIQEARVQVYAIGIRGTIDTDPALLRRITGYASDRHFPVERASNLRQIALEVNSAMRSRP